MGRFTNLRIKILRRQVKHGMAVRLYLAALMLMEYLRVWRYDKSLASYLPQPAKEGHNETTFHFVYFSCGRDFHMLCDSLRSLTALRLNSIGKVYLVIDRGEGFDNKQLEELRQAIGGNLTCSTSYYRMLRGPGGIIAELTAFREILPDMGERDILVKMDSDTLFLSTDMFALVMNSGSLLLGEEKTHSHLKTPFSHVQGGCYFMRRSLLAQVVARPLMNVIKNVCRKLGGRPVALIPEDIVIHGLATTVTDRIEYIDRKKSLEHFEGAKVRDPRQKG